MKYLIIVGIVAVALVLGGGLLAVSIPHEPSAAESWAAMQRAELAIQQEREAAGRWSIFWAGALVLAALGTLAGGAVAVDWYLRRRLRPELVYIGGDVPVTLTDIADGRAGDMQRLAVAGHYQAQIEAARRPVYPHHFAPHITHAKPDPAALPGPAELAAPVAVPTFADLLAGGQVGAGRPLLLGYSVEGALTGELKDWRSGAVAGLPGAGKTTTQRFIAGQAALHGARLVILDPHAGKGGDSLAGTLAPLAPAFLCEPADSPRAMIQALHLVQEIMQGRLQGAPVEYPLFIFVDEFTALMGRSDLAGPMGTIIEAIAQEGRASLVQAVISGQIWTADRAGGTALRDSLASTYVHRMKRKQAQVLLPTDDARRSETLATGAAILWRADGTIADVTVPYTTGADMVAVGRLLAGGGIDRATEGLQPARAAVPVATVPIDANWWEAVANPVAETKPATGTPGAAPPRSPISPDAARAARLFMAGSSPAEIVAALRTTKDKKTGAEVPITSSMGTTYQAALAEILNLIRAGMTGGAGQEGGR